MTHSELRTIRKALDYLNPIMPVINEAKFIIEREIKMKEINPITGSPYKEYKENEKIEHS